jgi:hypothetical protein
MHSSYPMNGDVMMGIRPSGPVGMLGVGLGMGIGMNAGLGMGLGGLGGMSGTSGGGMTGSMGAAGAAMTMPLPESGLVGGNGYYHLIVRQQPERARLCSFKEENDTSE